VSRTGVERCVASSAKRYDVHMILLRAGYYMRLHTHPGLTCDRWSQVVAGGRGNPATDGRRRSQTVAALYGGIMTSSTVGRRRSQAVAGGIVAQDILATMGRRWSQTVAAHYIPATMGRRRSQTVAAQCDIIYSRDHGSQAVVWGSVAGAATLSQSTS